MRCCGGELIALPEETCESVPAPHQFLPELGWVCNGDLRTILVKDGAAIPTHFTVLFFCLWVLPTRRVAPVQIHDLIPI